MDSRLSDFSSLEENFQLIGLVKSSPATAVQPLEVLSKKYPNSPQIHYQLAMVYAALAEFPGALQHLQKVVEIDSSLVGVSATLASLQAFFVSEQAKVAAEELKTIDPSTVFHAWTPITPLPEALLSVTASTRIDTVGWATVRGDPKTLVKLQRLWSIETGKIENLYAFNDGVTKSLIILGFLCSLIPHETDASNITDILQDQLKVIELIMDRVGNNNSSITVDFLKQLQSDFTATARITNVVTQGGMKVAALIRRGEFKFYPNSPTRSDKLIHQYCPPSKVASEINNLISEYMKYNTMQLDPVVFAAWVHHRFVQIHPFMDGNGRVARAIASIPLLKAGLPPLVIMSADRADYISALQQADQANDLKPLMEVIVKNVNSAIQYARNN